MVFNIICIFSVILSILAMLPVLNIQHWIVRDTDFPRLQLTSLLVVTTLIHLILFPINWWVLGLALIAISYELRWILPYSVVFPEQVRSVTQSDNALFSLRIISSNVLMSNTNYDALLSLVKQYKPDVLITLESDKKWQEALDDLDTDYPYSIKQPMENRYGIHVYSKLELCNSEVRYLVEDDVPSVHTAIPLPDGNMLRLHILHPSPPSPTESTRSTQRDAELLLVAKELEDAREPIVVAGDLNDVAWSRTTQTFLGISKMLDPRIGRGLFNTFHADYWFMRWPLDHLFHSRHFKVGKIKVLNHIGSDHFPLLCDLFYCPGQDNSDRLMINSESKEWASEQIENQTVANKRIPDPSEPSRE